MKFSLFNLEIWIAIKSLPDFTFDKSKFQKPRVGVLK